MACIFLVSVESIRGDSFGLLVCFIFSRMQVLASREEHVEVRLELGEHFF